MIRQIETAFLDGDLRERLLPPGAFELPVFVENNLLLPAITVISKLQKYQTEHRRGVLAGFEIGVGAQIIRGGPEIVFQLFDVFIVHLARY